LFVKTRVLAAVSHSILRQLARFIPPDEFRARMDRLIRAMKSTPPAKGYSEVLVAGEPELRMEEERARTGVPVGHGTWHALCQAADRLGVAVPSVQS